MKLENSITVGGITCALSFEVSREDLRRLLAESGGECSNEVLEDLVLQQGGQVHQLLSQAAKSFYSGLLVSYTATLRDAAGLASPPADSEMDEMDEMELRMQRDLLGTRINKLQMQRFMGHR